MVSKEEYEEFRKVMMVIEEARKQAKQEVLDELEKDILSIAVKGEITFNDMGKLLSKKKKEGNE